MRRTLRGLLIVSIVGLLVWGAGPALASDDDDGSASRPWIEFDTDWFEVGIIALDVMVLRPAGALSTLGGFGFFVASLPFVGPSGHIEATWDIFVFGPYDDTFVRPIGE